MLEHRTIRALAIVGLTAALLAACGGDDTASEPTSTNPAPAPPTVSAELQRQIDEICDPGRFAELPPLDGTAAGVAAMLAFLDGAAADTPSLDSLDVPPELQPDFTVVTDAGTSAADALEAAHEAAADGDVAHAEDQIRRHIAHLQSGAGRFALMGARCGIDHPDRAANADLNVPLDLSADQLNTGFGSVWVSQQYGGNVVRVDPATGAVLATIDVGIEPLKLQPADGRMWVRTTDTFVAIDPTTNTITDTLRKADVGPAVNRNYAIDGAMWICDGRRLHRYDPTTLEPVATVALDVDCDFVYATPDLVMTWNHDDAPTEAGDSATVIIDPNTNEVVATVQLPIDVIWPAVLDDTVYFGGEMNASGVVLDRHTWTVTSTVQLPDVVGGGGISTDGTSIFVPTRGADPWNVLVLDAGTFEVVDTIEPLNVNANAVDDGALWVISPDGNVLQRFDLEP